MAKIRKTADQIHSRATRLKYQQPQQQQQQQQPARAESFGLHNDEYDRMNVNESNINNNGRGIYYASSFQQQEEQSMQSQHYPQQPYHSQASKKGITKNYVPGFVGIEYECFAGHRHVLDLLTMCELVNWNYNDLNSIHKCYSKLQNGSNYKEANSNVEARITGSTFPNYDMPVRVPCFVCKEQQRMDSKSMSSSSRSSVNNGVIMAQLSRVHIVTPPAPVAITLHPRVQVEY